MKLPELVLCALRVVRRFSVVAWLAVNGVEASEREAFFQRLKAEYKNYTASHQDPATGLLYTVPVESLKTEKWDTVANVRKGAVRGVPSPHGYGSAGDSGIADTALFGGQMLYSMLEAYDARPNPDVKEWAQLLFRGMKIIGTTSPVPGFVVRGPHPNDRKAYYKDSSMDQHSTYVIALWRYYHSPLATEQDKVFIRDSLDKVARRLEKNQWRVLWEDDSQEAWASGGNLPRWDAGSVTLLLPMIGAAADVTGSRHWKETYERFAVERDGLRWKTLLTQHDGVGMTPHLYWGQQAIFRAHCLYGIEKNPARRQAILAHVKAQTEKRLAQEFPPQSGKGSLFELFNKQTLTAEEIQKLGWQRGFSPGPVQAWKSFKPEYLRIQPSALRSKLQNICILFPSSVFTMAVYSRNRELEETARPLVEEMVNAIAREGQGDGLRWRVLVPGWKAAALFP